MFSYLRKAYALADESARVVRMALGPVHLCVLFLLLLLVGFSQAYFTEVCVHSLASIELAHAEFNIADRLASEHARGNDRTTPIEQQLETLRSLAPAFAVPYFVSRTGLLYAPASLQSAVSIEMMDVAQIAQVAAATEWNSSIFGDDPIRRGTKVRYSAAYVRFGNEEGYLYVPLQDSVPRSLWSQLQQLATFSLVFVGSALAFLILSLVALCALFLGKFMGIRQSIAAILHDFRTPLSATHGYLDHMLLNMPRLTPKQITWCTEVARRNLCSIESLVSSLMELTRLEVSSRSVAVQPCALTDLANDVLLRLVPVAIEKKIELHLNADDGLPWIQGDPALLERLLINLLTNAIQHTPAGVRIELALVRRFRRLECRVTDHGCGIEHAKLRELLKGNYLGKSDTGGCGLGLAISARIVRLHRGTFAIRSEMGQGTTVVIRFPILKMRTKSKPVWLSSYPIFSILRRSAH